MTFANSGRRASETDQMRRGNANFPRQHLIRFDCVDWPECLHRKADSIMIG